MDLLYNKEFENAFGFKPRKYTLPKESERSIQVPYSDVEVMSVVEDSVKSIMGTPVVTPITFLAGSYKVRENGQVIEVNYDEFVLPHTSVLTISRAKRIEKTFLTGSKNSVKELYRWDDWKININGLLINNEDTSLPQDGILTLKGFDDVPNSISVEADILQWLGIYYLAIEKISLPPVVGNSTIQPFTLECSSDLSTNLIV